MKKDDRRRVDPQGLLYYDSGVNRGAIDGALKQLGHLDDPVPIIQKQASEHLVLAFGQSKAQIATSLLRAIQHLSWPMPFC